MSQEKNLKRGEQLQKQLFGLLAVNVTVAVGVPSAVRFLSFSSLKCHYFSG